jgi:hypothetical protein
MRLNRTELVVFALANYDVPGGFSGSLRLTVYDAMNTAVSQLTAPPSQTRTDGSVLLPRGFYALRIELSQLPMGTTIPFAVFATLETDPLGVQPVDPTDAPVVCPGPGVGCTPGDANLDGDVDISDFNVWNAFKFVTGTTWLQGDFNGDQSTDASDFNVWNSHRFTSSSVPPPIATPGGTEGSVELISSQLLPTTTCLPLPRESLRATSESGQQLQLFTVRANPQLIQAEGPIEGRELRTRLPRRVPVDQLPQRELIPGAHHPSHANGDERTVAEKDLAFALFADGHLPW